MAWRAFAGVGAAAADDAVEQALVEDRGQKVEGRVSSGRARNMAVFLLGCWYPPLRSSWYPPIRSMPRLSSERISRTGPTVNGARRTPRLMMMPFLVSPAPG